MLARHRTPRLTGRGSEPSSAPPRHAPTPWRLAPGPARPVLRARAHQRQLGTASGTPAPAHHSNIVRRTNHFRSAQQPRTSQRGPGRARALLWMPADIPARHLAAGALWRPSVAAAVTSTLGATTDLRARVPHGRPWLCRRDRTRVDRYCWYDSCAGGASSGSGRTASGPVPTRRGRANTSTKEITANAALTARAQVALWVKAAARTAGVGRPLAGTDRVPKNTLPMMAIPIAVPRRCMVAMTPLAAPAS